MHCFYYLGEGKVELTNALVGGLQESMPMFTCTFFFSHFTN